MAGAVPDNEPCMAESATRYVGDRFTGLSMGRKARKQHADAGRNASGQAATGAWSALQLKRLRMALGAVGLVAIVASLLLLTHDQPASAFFRSDKLPGDVRKAIMLSEAFAHGTGVVAILLALLLASSCRATVWVVAAMAGSSGIVANLLKALFVRARPYTYDEAGQQLSDVTGWQFLAPGSLWDASQRSFPSGHTATAWGLAIGLSLAYPRATPVFVTLASLATLQRLVSGAHFLSDVCAGLTIACWCCALILMTPWARERLEHPVNGAGDKPA
jgi:membrane-associated phospholipid phosphatase